MSLTIFVFPETPDEVDATLQNIAGELRHHTTGSTECFGSSWHLLVDVQTSKPQQCRKELLEIGKIDDLCRYILGMALMFKKRGAKRVDLLWSVNRSGLPPIILLFGDSMSDPGLTVTFLERIGPGHLFTREQLLGYLGSPEAN